MWQSACDKQLFVIWGIHTSVCFWCILFIKIVCCFQRKFIVDLHALNITSLESKNILLSTRNYFEILWTRQLLINNIISFENNK